MQIQWTHIVFDPWKTLPGSYLQLRCKECETGVCRVKMSRLFSWCIWIWDLRTTRAPVKMGVFFEMKWLVGNRRFRAPCLDSIKGWCITGIDGGMVFGEISRTGFGHHGRRRFSSLFCSAWFQNQRMIIKKPRDRAMQRHTQGLPACRCIFRSHRGIHSKKIIRKQVGILAYNLSDVIGTSWKRSWHDFVMCAPVRASHIFYSHFFRETARPFLFLYV